MKALGWWLMLVGSLRLASVWFGFFDIWALRLAVFSSTTSKLLSFHSLNISSESQTPPFLLKILGSNGLCVLMPNVELHHAKFGS